MPEGDIASAFPRPWREVRRKEQRRLKCRARRLLFKAKIARLNGNSKRRDELLTQVRECVSQALHLS